MKIFFHAVDGAGHMNALAGLAQALIKRGHICYVLLNKSFAGKYVEFGFKEILLESKAPVQAKPQEHSKTENPIKVMAKMILESGLLNDLPPLEKLKNSDKNEEKFMDQLLETVVSFNPQIENAIEREKPDLFVLDHFFIPPAILKASIPWIYVFSGNPLFLLDSPNLPPGGTGYSVDSDRNDWEIFRNVRKEILSDKQLKCFQKLRDAIDFDLDEMQKYYDQSFVIPISPYLNIYGYPKELDYQDIEPLNDNFACVDAFCRETSTPFEWPENFSKPKNGEKLVYFSLGSMGSIDVKLVKRIVQILGQTPHRYIVSKGPLADEYELPDNCWGGEYVPQTAILPLVDLVITHGGNNTVTESFCFGKPMIIFPLFGDQFDNAQRVEEKNYGIQLRPYSFKDEQLLQAIDKLLNDTELYERLNKVARRIECSNSKDKVCERIERVVQQFNKC